MIIAHIKVSGVTAACKRRSQIPARLVGGKIAIEYADPAWAELSKTAVFRGAVTRDVLNIGELVEIPQEVLAKVGADVYFGIEGRNADGTLVIPLIEAQLGKVMSSTDPSGDQSTTPELPVWQQILDLIGNLNDLTTEAKETLVEAINEAARKGGGSVDEKTVWEIVDEYLEKNPPVVEIPERLSQFENDTGFITRLVADLQNYYAKSQTYTKQEIDGKISAIPKFSINVVSALPTTGIRETTVYLLSTGSGSDLYTEYIYVDGEWEVLGSQRVDLTGYATEAWVEKKLEEHSGGNVDYVGVEPAEDDIPKIFFGGALQQTKDEKVVPFRYISKTDDFSGYAEIKAQGNSSMSYAKKNQTVKMYADEACETKMKVNFKGWGKQNKHVYKANWIDLSHSRNVVSARLWADVVKSRANYADLPELLRTSPNQGAVDGFPVKVYADGVYQGRYTLNIPKDKWMANMDDELDTHCILCGEGYISGCFREASTAQWTDEVHDTMPISIKNRWIEVINFVMNSTDEEFKENLNQYFFVDSLIDYHLFGLQSCGLDAYGKNQLYMTYDGQKWIASMYDMDSTWGLYWNGNKLVATDYPRTSYEDYTTSSTIAEGNLLYIRLEQLFWSELQERWAELKKGALSIENIINQFERFTDIAPAELVKEDYASTTGGGKFTGIPSQSTNNIQQIRAFALARQAWTDTYVAGLTPEIPVPCTGISLDKTTLTFTAEGTQTITATVIPDGCTDNVVWVSSKPSVATISVDGSVCTVTAVANGNATITVTCGDYSVSCAVAVSGLYEPVPCTGITLDKANLSFNGNESQTITATVTPSDTTDSVVWSIDDESVATVDNGVVTAVGNGTATITATCGTQSANCAVTVSGIADASLLYSLPESTTFDGTNHIDTGLKLFAEDKPFTVLVDWEHTGANPFYNNGGAIVHCIHEANPFPGFVVQYGTNGIKSEIRQTRAVTAASSTDGVTNETLARIRVVVTKDANCALKLLRRYNNNGEILSGTAQGTFASHEHSFLIGCYHDASDKLGRYSKGIMHDCRIYNRVLSDEEIADWINA